MQQIADWLEKLGLSEYADRFADNKIDVSVLPHLTDEDLKEIGACRLGIVGRYLQPSIKVPRRYSQPLPSEFPVLSKQLTSYRRVRI